MRTFRVLAAAALLAALAAPAVADDSSTQPAHPKQTQSKPVPPKPAHPVRRSLLPKGFIGGAVGGQVNGNDFNSHTTFTLYTESASFDTNYAVPKGLTFEGAGGIRLWRAIGVEVAFSHYAEHGDASLSASLPHPYFPNQPRALTATVPGLARTENSVHVGVLWMGRPSKKTLVTLSGGPSFIGYEQGLVTGLVLDETYPYDTVALSRATTEQHSGTKVGFHVAGDVYFKIAKQVAVGGGARFSHASVSAPLSGGQTATFDVGGFQVNGGLRCLF